MIARSFEYLQILEAEMHRNVTLPVFVLVTPYLIRTLSYHLLYDKLFSDAQTCFLFWRYSSVFDTIDRCCMT